MKSTRQEQSPPSPVPAEKRRHYAGALLTSLGPVLILHSFHVIPATICQPHQLGTGLPRRCPKVTPEVGARRDEAQEAVCTGMCTGWTCRLVRPHQL